MTTLTGRKKNVAAELGRNVSSFIIVSPWSGSMVTRRLVFRFASQMESCSLTDGELTAESSDKAVVIGSGLGKEQSSSP